MNASPHLNQDPWNFKHSFQSLPREFFQAVIPTNAVTPTLLLLNEDLVTQLQLNLSNYSSDFLANLFAGNNLPPQSSPIALAYAGHQFGHFTRLGDGRAILLGEHVMPDGASFDIQLKGSGRTPYSRNGDGLATLEAMLKEYLYGEALYALGVPTSRSLALVKTEESVYREKPSHRAIVTRVARSHLRIGSFEYAARLGIDHLKILADYAIERHYPHCMKATSPYLALLTEVMNSQAYLVAKWMSIGFIHGVLNTDNVLISGESIDFGPCAFMDGFDTSTVFSSIDLHGRYAYGEQPNITLWNLCRLAECLIPLIEITHPEDAIAQTQEALEKFQEIYQTFWESEFARKIGFEKPSSTSTKLVIELLNQMQTSSLDFTWTFRQLAHKNISSPELENWKAMWLDELAENAISVESAQALMLQSNPAMILRNHLTDQLIKDTSTSCQMDDFNNLLNALKSPFTMEADTHPMSKPSGKNLPHFVTYCGT